MPRVTDEYREQRRREIADAALRVFRRRGFHAASMADIIAEAGLSAGAIYGHYASKDELIKAVAAEIVGGRTAAFADFATAECRLSPGEVIRPFLEGILERVGHPAILVQLWGEAATNPDLQEYVNGVVGRLLGAFTDYIASWYRDVRGVDADEAKRLASEQAPLFAATCQGYILQASVLRDFDSDGFLDAAAEYLPK